jgi:phosphoesterase RecJ-like protein
MKGLGYATEVISPNEFPQFLAWMPGSSGIRIARNDHEQCKELIRQAGVIFCLDFNALDRLESLAEPVRKSAGCKILIDHHPSPLPEFDIMFSRVDTSSTAELVYEFIDSFGREDMISREVAECIYAGIMTDTGSFSFSCNYESTYRVVAGLIRKGIDAENIHRMVYDTYSEDRMRLLGFAISEKLVVLPEYHAAYIALTRADLNRFNYQIGDTEGIVNYALSIKGINLAVLLTERERLIRLSFRSKGHFSVNELARNHFEGGGHRNAAGGNSYISMEQTLVRLKKMLRTYKKDLDYD